jgi:hypothetical protein
MTEHGRLIPFLRILDDESGLRTWAPCGTRNRLHLGRSRVRFPYGLHDGLTGIRRFRRGRNFFM